MTSLAKGRGESVEACLLGGSTHDSVLTHKVSPVAATSGMAGAAVLEMGGRGLVHDEGVVIATPASSTSTRGGQT